MITGLTSGSYQNMQLNAGLFIKNLNYSNVANAAALAALIETNRASVLGATYGGGFFRCVPSLRPIPVDGARAAFVGGEVNDGWDVRISTTLKEATPDNFKLALMSCDKVTNGKVTTLTIRTEIKNADYLSNICWVGDLADGQFVLIEIANALNVNGSTFRFVDRGEGTLPVEFMGHLSSVLNTDAAPCKVVFFDKAT